MPALTAPHAAATAQPHGDTKRRPAPSGGPRRPASWVIVRRDTGAPVLETYDPLVLHVVDARLYRVVAIHKWLASLNAPRSAA